MFLIDFFVMYDVIISFFSWSFKENLVTYKSKQTQTFTVLIACHNEEDVIIDNLSSLFSSNYDKQLFHVYVIADNCSDKTELLCNDFKYKNSDCNLEIIPVQGGSKPKALNLGIQYLKINGLWEDDNIIILDADNKVSPNLLAAFNHYHDSFAILQCRIASANDDSFIARSFTSSFNTTTYSRQIARNKIGLSASLSGTGFSIKKSVFDEVDFQHCNTLTEDLEFSVLSILKGYKIKFIQEQYVLNQNLDEFKPSLVQRVRWCRGHMQVSSKLTGKLIIAFLKRPSFQILDTILFINTPIRTVLFMLILICIIITGTYVPLAFILLNLSILIYNVVYNIYCNDNDFSYIINQLHFGICMYFAIIYGALTYRKTVWAKTKHKKI